ncbi:MAG: FAD-dependent oxidoreductase [Acidobacteria bacterium]|nr:MAG: FAD-dependent oxidoreductase [Acidobacteriota bacterium]
MASNVSQVRRNGIRGKARVLPHHRKHRSSLPRVAILGGGPAGVGAAWQLAKHGKAEVILFEQRDDVGGNAGSFKIAGLSVDYGSHRLHPACNPQILADIRGLVGEDLLDRPRHGRIRLHGRWIHFPLKPLDLLFHLPPSFGSSVVLDSVRKLMQRKPIERETFSTVLERGLGQTICRDFYFPYAKKIWGLSPDELSPIQARRRVSAGSLGKMVRKVLGLVPGFKAPGAGRFYYPRGGYGQLSRAIASAATTAGADIRQRVTVKRLILGAPHRLEVEADGELTQYEAEYIWSTLPISVLARIVQPTPPQIVIEASQQIEFRAMILAYLVLDQQQWTPFDAHYFPETEIIMSRLSEPKNYSARRDPENKTVLCAEIPCSVNDRIWNASDTELRDLIRSSLEKCELPIDCTISEVTTRRLPFAYPIYRNGYEAHFDVLDKWAGSLDRVLSFGRQGLFAHDNTHHTLAMAYAAVDCFEAKDEFNTKRWAEYRTEFTKHVVED